MGREAESTLGVVFTWNGPLIRQRDTSRVGGVQMCPSDRTGSAWSFSWFLPSLLQPELGSAPTQLPELSSNIIPG